jgi:hypothetical protein
MISTSVKPRGNRAARLASQVLRSIMLFPSREAREARVFAAYYVSAPL